jgi:hypothetical protein
MPSHITILSVQSPPQRKTFFLDANGALKKRKPSFPLYFTKQEREVEGLDALFRVIKAEAEGGCSVILRGQYLPDTEIDVLEANRRKKVADLGENVPESLEKAFVEKRADGNRYYLRRKSLITDAPCPWVCFDFDDFRPVGVAEARFDVANPRPWVDAAIEQELGADFVGVDYVLQLSSSAGLPGSKDIRCHVWFWLDRPMDGHDWMAWFAARSEALGRAPKIDKGMFQASRVHYIAPPAFVKGAFDPVIDAFAERITLQAGVLSDVVQIKDWSGIVAAAEEARAKAASRKVDVLDGDDAEAAREAWERPGVVGAFNRVYPMSAVINTFLSPYYKIDSEDGRVTWLRSPSGSVGSCRIVAGNTRMFNTSSSDPLEGYVGSAFDHIEALLFDGDYHEAARWALEQPGVQEEMDKALNSEFDEWVEPPKVAEIELPVEGDEAVVKKVTTAEDVAAEYPMPSRINGKEVGYKSEDGDWWFGLYEDDEDDEDEGGVGKKGKKKKKGGGKKGGFRRLWSPIAVKEYLTDFASGEVTVVIKMMGPKGFAEEIAFSRSEIGNRAGVEKTLLARMWRAGEQERRAFFEWLSNTGGEPTLAIGRGWHDLNDGTKVFGCPSGDVVGAPEDALIRVQPDLTMRPIAARAGSLEAWREALDAHLGDKDRRAWALGVAAGVAGVLVPTLSQFACPSLFFAGEARTGKTTSCRIAVSFWAHPEPNEKWRSEERLFRSFNATINAAERLASNATGTVFCMDEGGSRDKAAKEDFQSFVYKITNGEGKSRERADGKGSREALSWSGFGVFSSEKTPASEFATATRGGTMSKGIDARMLTVPVLAHPGVMGPDGVWISGDNYTKAKGKEIGAALNANYGWAGPLFVERLLASGISEQELVRRCDALQNSLEGAPGGVALTARETLGILLLCGELLHEFGIVGTTTREAIDWAVRDFWKTYIDGQGRSVDDEICATIDEWFVANRLSLVWRESGGERPSFGETKGWLDNTNKEGEHTLYLQAKRVLEIVPNYEPSRVGRALKEKGRLIFSKNKNIILAPAWMGVGRSAWVYAIKVEGSVEENTPDIF